jgi:hypothetical protein
MGRGRVGVVGRQAINWKEEAHNNGLCVHKNCKKTSMKQANQRGSTAHTHTERVAQQMGTQREVEPLETES